MKKNSKESKVLQQIDEYLRTDFVQNNLDYTLYKIVNMSLDKTIEALGKDRVDKTVRQLRSLRKQVESKCLEKTIFPCSQNGTHQLEASSQNCYWFDSGCGYPCVDQVLLG